MNARYILISYSFDWVKRKTNHIATFLTSLSSEYVPFLCNTSFVDITIITNIIKAIHKVPWKRKVLSLIDIYSEFDLFMVFVEILLRNIYGYLLNEWNINQMYHFQFQRQHDQTCDFNGWNLEKNISFKRSNVGKRSFDEDGTDVRNIYCFSSLRQWNISFINVLWCITQPDTQWFQGFI